MLKWTTVAKLHTHIYMYLLLLIYLPWHVYTRTYAYPYPHPQYSMFAYTLSHMDMPRPTNTHMYVYSYLWSTHNNTSLCTHLQGSLNKFPDFFVWALLLIVHTWNSSPIQSNLLRLQCTCFTVPTTSGRPHGSPLVWACQWPSSQPLSSPQLSHNSSL